jgi:hypothetical protein
MSRTYAIIDTASVTDAMAQATVDVSVSAMRHTVRNTERSLLRWDGDVPSGADSLTHYTKSEIVSILNDESGDWWIDFEEYRNYTE